MSAVLTEMRRALTELDLGLTGALNISGVTCSSYLIACACDSYLAACYNIRVLKCTGALNISDVMDTLISNMALNQVPPLWLKMCGQIGPTGTYNRKSLSSWFADLLLRYKQLRAFVDASLALPPSVWIGSLELVPSN